MSFDAEFVKCIPAFNTDVARCGSVTTCNVGLPESGDLAGIFADGSGNPRLNDALFLHDLEIKSCEKVEVGLYDFLMANKADWKKRISTSQIGNGLIEIKPFIQAMRKSVINNNYWTVTNGTTTGAGDWRVDVVSSTGIPNDTRWFAVGDRVFIDGISNEGNVTRTAWEVVGVAIAGDGIQLNLDSQNANSNLVADKLDNPVTGVLQRGTPNVNDYERFCSQIPGLNTNSLTQYWVETTRSTLCVDELWVKYHNLLRAGNPQYKMFGDVEVVELNRQIGADFKRRWANTFFWNKPLPNQAIATYLDLEQITIPAIAGLVLSEEGRCVGRRANAIGVYEQMAECDRVFDAQGDILNLQELHEAIYDMKRIRESNGDRGDVFDLFTDSRFARLLENAYINYFRAKASGDLRLNWDINQPPQTGKFGFSYRSIALDWPKVTLNIISHNFFDDYADAHVAEGAMIWILQLGSGIYPAILDSNRQINVSGSVSEVAKVSDDAMCQMKLPKKTLEHTSFMWTAVVDCPAANIIIENISRELPEHRGPVNDADDLVGSFTTSA